MDFVGKNTKLSTARVQDLERSQLLGLGWTGVAAGGQAGCGGSHLLGDIAPSIVGKQQGWAWSCLLSKCLPHPDVHTGGSDPVWIPPVWQVTTELLAVGETPMVRQGSGTGSLRLHGGLVCHFEGKRRFCPPLGNEHHCLGPQLMPLDTECLGGGIVTMLSLAPKSHCLPPTSKAKP